MSRRLYDDDKPAIGQAKAAGDRRDCATAVALLPLWSGWAVQKWSMSLALWR
jgi:hypothetical protein